MKKILMFIAAGLLVSASAALALDDDAGRWGLGLDYGAWKQVGGDYDYSNVDQFGALRLRHGLSPAFSLDLAFKHGFTRPGVTTPGDDAGLTFDKGERIYDRIWQPSASLIYNLSPNSHWRPWLSGGIGVTRWDIRDLRGEDDSVFWPDGIGMNVYDTDGALRSAHGVNLTALLGVGLDYRFSSALALGLNVRTNLLLNQDKDTVGLSSDTVAAPFGGPDHVDANNQILEASLGLTWMFGGGEEMPAPVAKAAPAPAPVAPPAKPVTPPPAKPAAPPPPVVDQDRDKDGILNDADKCPDNAEDKDGFEDADGCPDPDNDGDGVLDGADRCPDTPKGVKVDTNGCEKTLVLEGVTFKTASAELLPASTTVLDKMVERLLAWPEVTVEVAGHTDNQGAGPANQKLSQARAESVRKYLESKGVAGNRLTAAGYGEDQPIADNTTPEGRAKNRRVELRRTDQ